MLPLVVGVVATLMTVIGSIVTLAIGTMAAVLIYRGTLRPGNTLQETYETIDWPFSVGLFVLLPVAAGATDGDPLVGAVFGVAYLLFFVAIVWWFGL